MDITVIPDAANTRYCTPVIYTGGAYVDLPVGARGVVLRVYDCVGKPLTSGRNLGSMDVAWKWSAAEEETTSSTEHVEKERIYSVGVDDCEVDLTDATGRAHVSWAIVRWLNENHGRRIPEYSVLRWSESHKVWHIGAADEASGAMWWSAIDNELSNLDHADDTRLGDGSRAVDALALRAIYLST